ncbi:membrane protein [Salmonella sp. NCTC 11881]|nr:membrane protein [Salmonella sp. NCTC 11881]
MLKIGVIADDFTGATDIASFLVENGMPTVQINDVPTGTQPEGCDAVVISLKTRSCPAQEAIKTIAGGAGMAEKTGLPASLFQILLDFR